MEADSSDVAANLAEVAEGADAAEANTANGLGADLEAVAATADTVEGGTQAVDESDSKTGRSARDRIQQLVGVNGQLTTEVDTLRAAELAQTTSIQNLTEMVNQGKADSELVNAIRSLNADPQHSEMVQQLDRILSGEEPEVDTSQMNETEKSEHASGLLEKRLNVAEETAAQQSTDALLHRADNIADRWLEALPEEYTDADREVIGTLWTSMVDWDGLDATGDPQAHLEPHLRETLQQAVDLFQEPRGGLVEAGSQESIIEPAEEIDPVEELQEAIAERNYGGIVTYEDGSSEFEVSEDDFTAELAAVMKARQD